MDLLTVDYRKEILDAAAFHQEATGRSRATIGNLVAKDKDFLDRLESGGGCTVDTFQNVMRWFQENTPGVQKLARKRNRGGT